MARAKSIVRPSRASKNLLASGLANEIEFSKEFHGSGLPLLISPIVLRSRQLGQIDLARLKRDPEGWLIEIGEVKSSQVGEICMERLQGKRLFCAQKFLAGLFGHRTKLLRLIKKKE